MQEAPSLVDNLMSPEAFIYAFTSDLGKLAIIHSSPVFFGVSYLVVFSGLLTPITLTLTKKPIKLPSGRATRKMASRKPTSWNKPGRFTNRAAMWSSWV